MIVRYVVPALGALAISATPIFAAETGLSKDAVTIGGWVDTMLTVAEMPGQTGTGLTAKEESGTGIEFSAMASLKVGWTLSDKAKARINLWFGNQDVNTGTPAYPGAINMREAYLVYDLGSNLSWTMGKYINHLGWESVEPTGLYRVNFGIVQSMFYGNDVVGTAIGWADKNSPFSGSFHVVNGYFNPADARNGSFRNNLTAGNGSGVSRPATRNNNNLGVGLDLVMGFNKNSKGDYENNINLEFAYDPNAGTNSPAAGLGGDVFQTGLNATITSIPKWVFGGEVIYRNTTSARPATGIGHVPGSHRQDFGWALLANMKVTDKCSVTANFQEVSQDWRGGGLGSTSNQVVDEYTLALLTQPLNNNNLGVNLELSYLDTQEHNAAVSSAYDHAWIGALEGIIIIP